MKELFEKYIKDISKKFTREQTSEMGYRTDFEILLKSIFESINVRQIDHDAKAQQGNKPDFVVADKGVPILYLEAKDIGVSLDKVEKSEQMARYFGYTNLVLTDYIEFRFYRNGISYEEPIKIADIDYKKRKLFPLPENYERLSKTLIEFSQSKKEPIKSGQHLAKIMGGKAYRIRENVKEIISKDDDENSELMEVFNTLKIMLVHDLNYDTFADMYAQTLVYGLFVARYYDDTPDNFSRAEARDLVPKSNPFLQHFFDHIAGRNFVPRLSFIVDELCFAFQHSDIRHLIEDYMEGADPVIHFYEDFLKEYDPELRKKMGAYYTPLPVVNFIVRSVDYILQKEFNLPNGLADTSKLQNGLHKVQILDPAVGTGTFISSIIQLIYDKFEKQKQTGRWGNYVHHDLLPRLFGFELMMTPYTIAHLKLSIKLKDTGFKYFNETKTGKSRLKIYLTNSLEKTETHQEVLALGFANTIAEEAKEADKIKNETPIMVVIGNPPYSVSSQNKGEWIQDLIKDYKTNLNEKNIQPLSDDYIKFIRFAESFIEKNKTGVVAMITNNSFIDGIIHRQMRKHLLDTFDDIYILDLHGNSKKKEKAPDGSKDENVFDIMQGVSISLFVRKNENKNLLGKVFHSELFGLRESKFEKLNNSSIENIKWKQLDYSEPYYFFVPKDFNIQNEYDEGFKVDSLFEINTSGIKTHDDDNLVSFSQFQNNNKPYYYRPFDNRQIEYNLKKVVRHRFSIMRHMLLDNLGIILRRTTENTENWQQISITKKLIDINFLSAQTYLFPLYLYSDDGDCHPNLNMEIVEEIAEKLKLNFTDKRDTSLSLSMTETFCPIDVLDYIYAVLHSPTYRQKYKEFLKIDFPRVPYPKDKEQFFKLVSYGTELREIHLLESSKVSQFITTFPVTGSEVVEKVYYQDGNVYFNKEQYFGNVPEIAWNFYIGGYQPAQKWLKDRKGRTLTNEDVEHYQKVIVALTETKRIMKEIDNLNLI
ncbi:MAG: N-6 DNA methylase [Ignavibacteriales bacterium]|nr:N-6 DNA methylase [Ignavibacteriales bacterium]